MFVLVQKVVVARLLLGCSGLWLAGNQKANLHEILVSWFGCLLQFKYV